ncbi:MAG: ATP-binding protein [Rubritalea sp.]|uniref:two-component system sensor histidine kinase NtrB n=1 Tax=Rubritalea sp. TaxID=2109375 RepID=UPI0032424F28
MKDGFLDKLITRLDRFSPSEVQNLVSRLVRDKGFLENVFEALKEGLFILSPEGIITFANQSVLNFFGIDQQRSIGQHINTAIRGFDWNSIASPDTVTNRDLEVFYPEHLTLNFYTSPIKGHVVEMNEHLGYVMLVRDVTESQQEAADFLESEKLNALTLLAAGVAHEIGNPLNSLDIHLQLMQRKLRKLPKGDQAKLGSLLTTAQGEIKRLDSILKQFLNAVRPTSPVKEKRQLHDILKTTLSTLEAELQSRHAQVTLNLADNLPLLNLDADQIQQALYNLIRNAAQALPASGGDLWIDTENSDYEVTLSIRDNGSGISPEHMGSLYEPYKTTKSSGTGLGLLVVRRIIREHGGEIEIQSEVNEGTTVRIHIPREERQLRLLPDNQPEIIDLELE